jgi:hypothetical protein
MNEAAPDAAEIPPRGEIKAPFCCIGNEVFDIFLPIIGADCFMLYTFFVRRVYSDPKLRHTLRGLADATGIGISTVSRSLEILEHLRLVKLTRFGGSKESECELKDSRVVLSRLGAKYQSKTLSFSLPLKVAERLKAEVLALREKQQGKSSPIGMNSAPRNCGNLTFPVSQRNASVSPAIRQRSARETQTGSHLLQEERRNEEVLSPTPFLVHKSQTAKDSPDEDGPDSDLRWAQAEFTGVMKNMGSHLLNSSRPPNPHLTNGYADWQEFGFNSLGVERVSWRGETLVLVLSATDPAAARRGLDKYRKRWEESLYEWYECKVDVELQQAQRK